MRYPEVVHINILLASGLSLVRISPFVWNTRLYTKLSSVKLYRTRRKVAQVSTELYREIEQLSFY